MGRRLDLHQVLVDQLGSSNVYFQPPPNVQMKYPCIVYSRDTTFMAFAGNFPYKHDKRYQVTVIDRNPDSEVPDRISKLPKVAHQRTFATDGLNHDVFNLFF